MKLLTTNTKLQKTAPQGYALYGLQLLPNAKICTSIALNSCMKSCLDKTGFAKIFTNVNKARKERTDFFLNDQDVFLDTLCYEIHKLSEKHSKLAIRLNTFSDIDWPEWIMLLFPNVQFYDYTKDFSKMKRFLAGELPSNYYLTFSYAQDFFKNTCIVTGKDFRGLNDHQCDYVLKNGGNVAYIYKGPTPNRSRLQLGSKADLIEGIDGDVHDARFLDGSKGKFIFLKFKS